MVKYILDIKFKIKETISVITESAKEGRRN